jgi:hypothetical protein
MELRINPTARHCERSEAIQGGFRRLWIAARRSVARNDEAESAIDG